MIFSQNLFQPHYELTHFPLAKQLHEIKLCYLHKLSKTIKVYTKYVEPRSRCLSLLNPGAIIVKFTVEKMIRYNYTLAQNLKCILSITDLSGLFQNKVLSYILSWELTKEVMQNVISFKYYPLSVTTPVKEYP